MHIETSILSHKLAMLGRSWPELAGDVSGLDASSVYRDYVRMFAGQTRWQEILEYWSECAVERLAALKGPYSKVGRVVPEESSYRSKLLDRLSRSSLDADHSKSNELEPTLREYGSLPLADPRRIVMVGAVWEFKRDAASQLFPRNDDTKITDRTVGKIFYEETIGNEANGFDINRKGRGMLFGTNVFDSSLRLVAYFDHSLGHEVGKTSGVFVVRESDAGEIDVNNIASNSLATFTPGDLIPGFDFSLSFENNRSQIALQAELVSGLFKTTARHLDL